MFHKITSISPLPDFRIFVRFENDEARLYDVKPLFAKWQSFTALRDVPGLFEQARVDAGGYGLVWNNELDLACDEL